MDKPQPLQPEELKAIEARCEAATPGPWGRGCLDEEMVYATTEIASTGENGPLVAETYAVNASSDADFIAHARTDIPRLIATIESRIVP